MCRTDPVKDCYRQADGLQRLIKVGFFGGLVTLLIGTLGTLLDASNIIMADFLIIIALLCGVSFLAHLGRRHYYKKAAKLESASA